MVKTNRCCIAVAYRERETGKEWDNDNSMPRSALFVGADDAVNECVSDSVLHASFAKDSAGRLFNEAYSLGEAEYARSDEELILDVDEVLGKSDRCKR